MNVNISLPKQYTEFLKAEKKRTGNGASEIVRRALDLYREKKPKDERGEVC